MTGNPKRRGAGGLRHENHHFIPRFLLGEWECGEDKKLTAFEWKNGRLLDDRHKAKSVGAQPGIYSFSGGPHFPARNYFESGYLQHLDHQASLVHRLLRTGPPVEIHPQDKIVWAQFIMSLVLRNPWELDSMVQDAPAVLARRGEQRAAAGLQSWPDESPPDAAYMRDITLFSLASVMSKSATLDLLVAARWAVINVSDAPVDLLIGDRPVFREGPLDGQFLIALPLSPSRLFLISNGDPAKNLIKMHPREVAQRTNRTTVAQAMYNVFATSDAQRRLLEKSFDARERPRGGSSGAPAP